MKFRVKSGLGFGLALSSLALAATAAAATSPLDPSTVGGVSAVLNYCRHVNPSHGAAYDALKASIFGQQPDTVYALLARSSEYKAAFNQMHGVLYSAPLDWGLAACRDVLVSGAI